MTNIINFMDTNNVYYINVKPYVVSLPYEVIGNRYYDANSNSIPNKESFIRYVVKKMREYNSRFNPKDNLDYKTQLLNSKEILLHLQQFFKISKKNYTKNNLFKLKKAKNITHKNKIQ